MGKETDITIAEAPLDGISTELCPVGHGMQQALEDPMSPGAVLACEGIARLCVSVCLLLRPVQALMMFGASVTSEECPDS